MFRWIKKHKWLSIFIGGAVLLTVFDSPASPLPTNATPSAPQYQPISITSSNQEIHQTQTSLSNDNYYMNVSGKTVHSPAYSANASVPKGASAQCRDGTYSFSQHRSGTCSHHGGVAHWF